MWIRKTIVSIRKTIENRVERIRNMSKQEYMRYVEKITSRKAYIFFSFFLYSFVCYMLSQFLLLFAKYELKHKAYFTFVFIIVCLVCTFFETAKNIFSRKKYENFRKFALEIAEGLWDLRSSVKRAVLLLQLQGQKKRLEKLK